MATRRREPPRPTLSKFLIHRALSALGDLLKQQKKRVELVAAGGVPSVLQFGNRSMTRDIDVIMPPADRELFMQLADRFAHGQGLPRGEHAWLNDGVLLRPENEEFERRL